MKGKKIKEVNPYFGMFSTIKIISEGKGNPFRESDKVFRVEEDDWIVDTCIAHDTETWETGINQNKKWIVVEQYKTEKEAEKGHSKWVKLMRENPEIELEDINVWGI